MGSVFRRVKKTFKKVTKPISKVTKGIAKGIAKVAKSVMKGVAKINKKLGPLGSIAMAIAMPYALSGLSTAIGTAGGTTGLMNSSNLFLRSIGQVGNAIRTGYQATTGAISNAMKGITKSISEGFTKFAGQGEGNIFTKISEGAKNLYNSAKNTVSKYNPLAKKGTAGQVEVFGDYGEVIKMDVTKAQDALIRGTIKPDQLGTQFKGSNTGFFTKATTAADRSAADYITETINGAYKNRLDGYSDTAMKYFNDVKNAAINNGTYINDAEIGSIVSNSVGTTQKTLGVYTDGSLVTDFDVVKPDSYQIRTNVDLMKTGDYKQISAPGEDAFMQFTGDKSFNTNVAKKTGLSEAVKKSSGKIVSSLKKSLFSKDEPILEPPEVALMSTSDGVNTSTNLFASSANLSGGSNANLFRKVFGDRDAQILENYHKHMGYEDTSVAYDY
jgi:hypothetical protein